jgi:hypothetical protein
MDTKGNGLLLVVPQRLFVTSNDGASWTQIASPGIGARAVQRDGADKIFLEGYTERAKLEGGRLVVTTETEEPIRKLAPGGQPEPPTRSLLSGDHVVDFVFRKGARPLVEVMSHKIGEPGPKNGAQLSELVAALPGWQGNAGISPYVAAWGSTLVYARSDDTKDEGGAVTTTILRSTDYGSTWKTDASFKGHILEQQAWGLRPAMVAAGPNGWSFVKTMCPPNVSSDQNEACTHKQVRPAGVGAFEDMLSVEDFTALHFVFDEQHNKVYALGAHDNKLNVYESLLTQNKFTKAKALEVPQTTRAALTVDSSGILRAMTWDASTRQWTLQRRAGDGTDMPTLYLSIDWGDVAFAGARGVVASDHRSWETADGGETWSRVAANGGGSADLACTDAGCTMGGAERAGWELPAYQTPEKATASSEAKKAQAEAAPSRPTGVTPAALELTCKSGGAPTAVTSTPGFDVVDERANDVRWYTVKDEKDRKISIVTGTRTGTRELPLVGPEPPKPTGAAANTGPQHHTVVWRNNEGVVVVRAVSASPAADTADLDLAWWSVGTNRVSRKSLPKQKGVTRWGAVSEARVVDGGLVLHVTYTDPVRFFRDDGKEETFTAPSGISLTGVVRDGNRWLVPVFFSGTAKIVVSDDGGKTWKSKVWRLDDFQTPSFGRVGGKLQIGVQHAAQQPGQAGSFLMFPLDSIGDDPPAPVVVSTAANDKACDATAATFRTASFMGQDVRPVQIKLEEPDKSTWTARAYQRVVHPTQGGSTCTAAYQMSTWNAFLYEDAKGFSGYRFKRTQDPKDSSKGQTTAEPLACAEAKKP